MKSRTQSATVHIGVVCATLIAYALIAAPLAHAEEQKPLLRAQVKAEVRANATSSAEYERKRAMIASTTAARLADMRENYEEKRAQLASSTQERMEKFRARFDENVLRVLNTHVENIIKRLTAALERFTDIAARMESRIETLEARGVDMTTAISLHADAEAKIADAKVKVDAIDVAVDAALASENPREAFSQMVRPAVSAAETALREAHKALVAVLRAIKAADVDASVSADSQTSTSENGDDN